MFVCWTCGISLGCSSLISILTVTAMQRDVYLGDSRQVGWLEVREAIDVNPSSLPDVRLICSWERRGSKRGFSDWSQAGSWRSRVMEARSGQTSNSPVDPEQVDRAWTKTFQNIVTFATLQLNSVIHPTHHHCQLQPRTRQYSTPSRRLRGTQNAHNSTRKHPWLSRMMMF